MYIAVSLVSWILNHMYIKEIAYLSILSLVKNDIHFRSQSQKNTHIVIHYLLSSSYDDLHFVKMKHLNSYLIVVNAILVLSTSALF